MKKLTKNAVFEFFSASDEQQAIRNCYKYTDCGAFIEFKNDGIVIGSIVEGSDVGTQIYNLNYNKDKVEKLSSTMELIEAEASLIWAWANEINPITNMTDAESGIDCPVI
jgi:hypothetical protein